jgi:hypothetical protein
VQRTDWAKTTEFTKEFRTKWGKPVVWDEICYEGNIDNDWGNVSGVELVYRFWEAAVQGGYAGHGETFANYWGTVSTSPKKQEVLWWSHGGPLHGESPARIRFLQRILSETPGLGLKPYAMDFMQAIQQAGSPEKAGPILMDQNVAVPEDDAFAGTYFLVYFGRARPSFKNYRFPEDSEYEVEVIDTWDMTVNKVGKFRGAIHIELPGKEFIALRIKKV